MVSLFSNPSPMLRSPARRALSVGLDVSDSHDLRWWLRFETAPLSVCRQFAADVGLGCYTRIFGEAAERRFCERAYRLYELRDRQGFVDLWMELIQASYVATFSRTAGAITGLELCISQPVGAPALPAGYVAETLRAIRWGLPWFAELPAPGLVITVCARVQASKRLTLGAYARANFDAIV